MKKFIKITLYAVLAIVIVVIAAIAALPFMIDPNAYKPEIMQLVKKHTGHDLVLEGEIKLSIFPWLGLDIGKIQLRNAEGFSTPHFAEITQARAQIQLLSFFSDQLEIGELELHGLRLNLERRADGQDNWSSFTAAAESKDDQPDTPSPAARKRFAIHSIEIKDAALQFNDRQQPRQFELNHIYIQTGRLQEHSAFPLTVQLKLAQSEPAMQGEIQLHSQLSMDLTQQHFRFDDLTLHIAAQSAALPDGKLTLQLQLPSAQVDIAQQQLNIERFSLDINEINSSGQFSLASFDNPQLRFQLNIAQLDLNPWLPKASNAGESKQPVDPPTVKTVKPTPLVIPPELDMQGTVNINEILLPSQTINTFQLVIHVKNGRGRLQTTAQLFEGSYQSDIHLNTKTQPVRWQMQHQLRGIAFGPLVQAISDKDVIRGNADIEAKLTTEGLSVDAWQRHLNGEARLHVTKPQLTQVDLHNWLLGRFYDKFKLARRAADAKDVTVFDELRASVTIQNGVVNNQDLLATSDRNHLSGKGQANLPAQTIDYTVSYIPKKSYVIPVGGREYDLKDEPIPISIRGPWAGPPKVDPDPEEVVKRIQKRSVERKVETQKEQLKEKASDKVDKLKDKLKQRLIR